MTPEIAQAHNQRAFLIVAMTLVFCGAVGYLIAGGRGAAYGLAGASLVMGILQLLD